MDIKTLTSVCLLALLGRPVHAELILDLPETAVLSSESLSAFNGRPVNFSGIGIKRLRSIRKSAPVIEDPELNDWIRGIGRRLVAQSSHPSRPFYFIIVKDDAVNAFATLGGLIVINSGLILRSESESELAAVMAHEVAHVTQQHIERMIAQSENNKLGNAAAIVAGLLVGSKDASAGQAIVASAMAVDAHRGLSFGRSAETEADREGLRILANAGFDPNGMTGFLRKLGGGVDSRYSGISEYLTSHPLSSRRVSDVGQRAAQYGVYKGKSSPSYYFMQEKLRLLTRGVSRNAKVPKSVINYGNAFQAFQQGKPSSVIQTLLRGRKTNHETLLLANSYIQQQKFQQAVQLLQPRITQNPNDASLLTSISDALIGLKRPADAWGLLKKVRLGEQTSLEFLGIRQEVARLAGRTAQAYLSIAERNIRIGLYNHALIQLKQALKVPKLTLHNRQKIEGAIYRAKQYKKP